MERSIETLRAICSAIMAANFKTPDRLKAILQTAYELLGASSIVAYRYNRVAERLAIFAMPGVSQREMMRGPTQETVFSWEEVTPEKPPTGIWLENTEDYCQYVKRLPETGLIAPKNQAEEDFRSRELAKHGGKGDLAVAKICLYKGVGQTLDRVGQIFFNFYKANTSEKTFDENLKAAIWFVALLVRELLIEELYHFESADSRSGDRSSGTLGLLHAIDEKFYGTRLAVAGGIALLPRELQQLLTGLTRRIELLKRQCAVEVSEDSRNREIPDDINGKPMPIAASFAEKANAHTPQPSCTQEIPKNEIGKLGDRLARSLKSKLESALGLQKSLEERSAAVGVEPGFKALIHEVFSDEVWRMVCRAALSAVETYGGQADIVLVLGGNLAQRIDPNSATADRFQSVIWLAEESVSGYCIQRGKVFVCNNVVTKASEPFLKRFRNEPGVEQYKSLLVVPVMIEGEVRALLRLMSTDEDCFLDRHALAMQDIAFVLSYALGFLDSFQRRDKICEGLSFFAEGQAVADRPSLPDLLRSALRVLGGNFAVFWPVHREEIGQSSPFDKGLVVDVCENLPPVTIGMNDSENGVRAGGLTNYISQSSRTSKVDLIFCLHVLSEMKRPSAPGKATPEYALQVFADGPSQELPTAVQMPDGFRKAEFSSNNSLPWKNETIELSDGTPRHLHSQIGFAVKERGGGEVQGVVWVCCEILHHLGWWERLYIRGLSNYLAQALKANNLQIAIRSFRHMIPNIVGEAMSALKYSNQDPSSLLAVENLPLPPSAADAALMADDVLYMTARKAQEVKSLLNPPRGASAFGQAPLSQILHRAAAIASELTHRSSDFHACTWNQESWEHAGDFRIGYGPGANPDLMVNESLFTAAANLLTNARAYGEPPYIAWACVKDESLRVLVANAGKPLAGDPIMELVLTAGGTGRSGVGLALTDRVVKNEKGSVRFLDSNVISQSYPTAWPSLSECRTFFEIAIPLCEGASK